MFNRSRNFFLPTVFAFVFSVTLNFWVGAAHAASETEIDIKVEAALTLFKAEVLGGEEFLKRAKGILIFPDIIKAGLFLAVNMAKAPCALAARPWPITARSRPPSVSNWVSSRKRSC